MLMSQIDCSIVCEVMDMSFSLFCFRMDPEENEVLDGLVDIELEIKNSASKLAENLDEKFNELAISVNHMKANVLQVVQQVDMLAEVKEKVTQVSKTLSIASSVRCLGM